MVPVATTRRELGDFLWESGLITREQLAEARRKQRETGERLGRVLVNLGYLSEKEIITALETRLGIIKVDLYDYNPPGELLNLIPEQVIKRHKALPLEKKGNTLVVALPDPLNLVVLDDLRLATGLDIEAKLAPEDELDRAVNRVFGGLKELEILQNDNPDLEIDPDKYNLDQDEADQAAAAPVIRIVNTLLQQAISYRASDVHLEPQEKVTRVRFRCDGLLKEIMNLPRRYHAALVSRIKIMGNMNIAEHRNPQDGRVKIRIEGSDVDLRVSTLPTIFGEKVVIRILDQHHMDLKLADLGFTADIHRLFLELVKRPYGMFLVSGPTGSGKTTTLYSVLQELNSPELNIITVEDPVEYTLPGINQVQVNNKAGLSFASGLRSILRQDPDIIMVGEIRDEETAEIAIRAAMTGHLVLSTLHTTSAAGTVTRLVEMNVAPYLVAAALIGVLSQRLVRRVCPRCREPYEVPDQAPERVFLGLDPGIPLTLYRGTGCSYCDGTGYRGRAAINELLAITPQVRELILKRASLAEIEKMAVRKGFRRLREDGVLKVLEGVTTISEVRRVSFDEEAGA